MKPLLVGELNPYGRNPKYALFPVPRRSAGGRLCYDVLGMQVGPYLKHFDRVNLCTEKWSAKAARLHADELKRLSGRQTILLGAKVAKAFGVEFLPFTVQDGMLVLPHPSGLCRLWNEPGAYDRAREVVRGYVHHDENPTSTRSSEI